MRLTLKLIVAIAAAILLVLSVSAFVRVKREVPLLEDDIRRDSRLLGRALAGAVSRIWTTVGEAEALDLVEDADERESHVVIRWLWLEDDGSVEGAPALPPDALRLFARGEDVSVKAPSPRGELSLYTYLPVTLADGRLAVIELRESLAAERRYVRRTIVQAAVATGILVLICSLLAAGLGVLFVGRPTRRLVEQARRIGAGDISPQAAPRGRDELADLGREMNAMSERLLEARRRVEAESAARLATQEQLRHADRLTTVGRLAAGIAHEIGTPLNVITGHAQLVRDEAPLGSSTHENAVIITEQAQRVADIVRQLLGFARPRAPQKASHDLCTIARQVTSLVESLARKRGVALELMVPDDEVRAEVDAGQIQQVLTNLVVNGLQAMSGGGVMTVSIEQVDTAERTEYARIVVEDRGAGIPEESLPRIFEPFFTTKDIGEGTGLGLSIAYGMVKEHGGRIEVSSVVGRGSRFAVYLPGEDCNE